MDRPGPWPRDLGGLCLAPESRLLGPWLELDPGSGGHHRWGVPRGLPLLSEALCMPVRLGRGGARTRVCGPGAALSDTSAWFPRLASREAAPLSRPAGSSRGAPTCRSTHIHPCTRTRTHMYLHTQTHAHPAEWPALGGLHQPLPHTTEPGREAHPREQQGGRKTLNSPTPSRLLSLEGDRSGSRAQSSGRRAQGGPGSLGLPSSVAMGPMDLGGPPYRQRLTVLRNQGHRAPGDKAQASSFLPQVAWKGHTAWMSRSPGCLTRPAAGLPNMPSSWAGAVCTGGLGSRAWAPHVSLSGQLVLSLLC